MGRIEDIENQSDVSFPFPYLSQRCKMLTKFSRIFSSTGKIELEIEFPSEQITSAAFGGPNLDILYVTSAATERSGPQPPPAGSLFKVTGLGVKGLPMNKVRL